MQQYDNNSLWPTGYDCRTLMAAEPNYDATERYCISIVWSSIFLHLYFYGRNFEIQNYHDLVTMDPTPG